MDESVRRIHDLQQQAAGLLARVDELERRERHYGPGTPEALALQEEVIHLLGQLSPVLAELQEAIRQRHQQIMARLAGEHRQGQPSGADVPLAVA